MPHMRGCFAVVFFSLPFAVSASGQISLDVTISADQVSNRNTVNTASFSTSSPNELLLAFVAADSTTSPNTTVTQVSGGGLVWRLVKRTNVQKGTAEIWAAFATSTLTASSVTATLSQKVDSSLTVMSFTGVNSSGSNGSGAIGAVGTANAGAGAPSAMMTTSANGSVVVGVGNDWDNAIARSPGAGQTVVHQFLAPVQDTYWVQMLNAPVPLSGTTVTINDTAPTSDRYNLSIVEIVAATGGTSSAGSVSGAISPAPNGNTATVTLSQNGAVVTSTTVGNSGTYSFSNISNGTYTVTPSEPGFSFNPANRVVTVSGGIVSGVNFAAVAQTFSISGTITGGSGATVTLSGAASATTTANSSGSFTFSGLSNGTYTITPRLNGDTISPTSAQVTVSGANVSGINFSATVITYSISGTITPTTGGSGATVNLSGHSAASTTTNGSGAYSFSALGNGAYIVTPSNSGYTFTPASQSVTVSGASVSAINFTAVHAAATYTISGTISPASVGAGTTLTLSGAASSATTADSNGNYSFTSLSNGSYSVTPSSATATFSPTSTNVTVNGANVTGVNFTATASAQSACGNTLDWTYAICQQIGSGSLNPQWTVISRHGEYGQNESECNVPSAITQAPNLLTITMTAAPYTCGNFNANGTIDNTPQQWPYSTGDIQWNTFSIAPLSCGTVSGCVPCGGTCTITITGSMPSPNTGTWPAFWLLGQNCQDANKYSGDTGFDGCPNLGSNGYIEIDTTECYNGASGWCQFHVANPNFGIGNGCDATYQVSTAVHTFQTVWTSSSIKQYMDGTLETTCNQSITNPMFLIMQIQSAYASGQTPNNSYLPAVMTVRSVQVTDAAGSTIFSDRF